MTPYIDDRTLESTDILGAFIRMVNAYMIDTTAVNIYRISQCGY